MKNLRHSSNIASVYKHYITLCAYKHTLISVVQYINVLDDHITHQVPIVHDDTNASI